MEGQGVRAGRCARARAFPPPSPGCRSLSLLKALVRVDVDPRDEEELVIEISNRIRLAPEHIKLEWAVDGACVASAVGVAAPAAE